MADRQQPFSPINLQYVVREIRAAAAAGARMGIVIGGGNIMRGRSMSWLDRITADYCGMTATIINGLILQQFLVKAGLRVRLIGGLRLTGLVAPYQEPADRRFFEQGGIPVFVAGTGNPLFTTDTAAALRAAQMKVDLLIKATNVSAVYRSDPRKFPNARPYRTLSYREALRRRLGIMDQSAFCLCQEKGIPICVYHFRKHRLIDVIAGRPIGTLVR